MLSLPYVFVVTARGDGARGEGVTQPREVDAAGLHIRAATVGDRNNTAGIRHSWRAQSVRNETVVRHTSSAGEK